MAQKKFTKEQLAEMLNPNQMPNLGEDPKNEQEALKKDEPKEAPAKEAKASNSSNLGVWLNSNPLSSELMFGNRKKFTKGFINIETEEDFEALSKTEDFQFGYVTKK